jgi:hypothetical protein
MPDETLCLISKLPPELLVIVFSYLDRLELIRCLAVSRVWNDILINHSAVWPSHVCVTQDDDGLLYKVEQIPCRDVYAAITICKLLSKLPGTIKSLKLELSAEETLCYFIGCFSSLESLQVLCCQIPSQDLLYILYANSTLRSLQLEILQGTTSNDQSIPTALVRPTSLRELDLWAPPELSLLIFNLVSKSPDLTSLAIRYIAAHELTRLISEKLEFLALPVDGHLPRLNCKILRALHLKVTELIIEDEEQPVDLSHVRCFGIHFGSDTKGAPEEHVQSIMQFYKIGHNLQCLTLTDNLYEPCTRKIELREISGLIPNLETMTVAWPLLDSSSINHILDSCRNLEIFYYNYGRKSDYDEELLKNIVTSITDPHRYGPFNEEVCAVCHVVH